MAKRPAKKKTAPSRTARSSARSRATAKGGRKATTSAKAAARPKKAGTKARTKTKTKPRPTPKAKSKRQAPTKVTSVRRPSRLPRARRSSYDDPSIPTPPSSLDMNRRGTAARTGRAEIAEHQADHASLTPSIAAGDVDVNVEDAYFSGDEAPGGDNQTPGQDIVDDIGKALGVEYQDDEELHSGDKVAERDRHRWELDPASAEDYRERVQSEEKGRRRKARS